MKKTPKPGPQPLHLPTVSAERGGPNVGDWVVVATVPDGACGLESRTGVQGVPVMHREARTLALVMRRYQLKEEAMAAAPHHNSAVRVGGGWILNLRTGETVRVNPMT